MKVGKKMTGWWGNTTNKSISPLWGPGSDMSPYSNQQKSIVTQVIGVFLFFWRAQRSHFFTFSIKPSHSTECITLLRHILAVLRSSLFCKCWNLYLFTLMRRQIWCQKTSWERRLDKTVMLGWEKTLYGPFKMPPEINTRWTETAQNVTLTGKRYRWGRFLAALSQLRWQLHSPYGSFAALTLRWIPMEKALWYKFTVNSEHFQTQTKLHDVYSIYGQGVLMLLNYLQKNKRNHMWDNSI